VTQGQAITAFDLIANNGFTTEDYPEPRVWASVIQAMCLRRLEYFADHMEPVLLRRVIEGESEFFQATRLALTAAGLTVWSGATARVSYLLNMLSHPYADCRREAVRWCCAFIDLTRKLGGRFISGHYDCIPKDEVARDLPAAIDRLVAGLLEVADYAADAGLAGIFLEQMHRAQLQPYTIAGAHDLLDRLNARAALPFHIHLDTGHAAFVRDDPRHAAADRDIYRWLAEPFGRNELLLIHAQQCDDRASRHWPFTAEYNRRGIIDARRVIRAVEQSGVRECIVALEVLFPRGTDIEVIRPAMVESADYWRAAFAAEGYALAGDQYRKVEDPT
jgi:hypothetical protein